MEHNSKKGGVGKNAKTIKYVWSGLLCIMIFSSCSNNHGLHMDASSERINKGNKKIVLVCDHVFPKDFRSLSEYKSDAAQKVDTQKEIIFCHVRTVNAEHEYHEYLASMHNRAELFKKSVKKAIRDHGWNQEKDDFIVIGHQDEGLAVLEAAETLKKEINMKRLILIGTPLNGYEFMEGGYAESRGPIGLMLKGMRQAILGRDSTTVEELKPNSEYLRQRHAFIESQTNEEDLKINIIDASSKNICLKDDEEAEIATWQNIAMDFGVDNSITSKEDFDIAVEQNFNHFIRSFKDRYPERKVENLDHLHFCVDLVVRRAYNRGIKEELKQAFQSKCKRDLDRLYTEVAQSIRQGYHKASEARNSDHLPGVEEFKKLRSFIENKGKIGYYLFFEKLNGGEEHDGVLSVSTQRGGNITNPRVEKSSFDGYAGTLSIPYKELKDLGPLNIFGEEDYIFSNTKFKEEVFRLIVEEKQDL